MLTTLALAMTLSTPAHAVDPGPIRQPGRFGLGFGGGTSTAGVSMKYFTSKGTSLQGVVGAGYGWGRFDNNPGYGFGTGLGLSGDFLFEGPDLASGSVATLGWNIGPGVGLWLDDNDAAVAAAGVLGMQLGFIDVPIGLTLEYRPRVLLAPYVGFDPIGFTGHMRFYF